jgi:hypothetical protein
MFAVPKRSIHRRPKHHWRWLRDQIIRSASGDDAHPLDAYAIEALMRYLYSDPQEYPLRVGGTMNGAPTKPACKHAAGKSLAVLPADCALCLNL